MQRLREPRPAPYLSTTFVTEPAETLGTDFIGGCRAAFGVAVNAPLTHRRTAETAIPVPVRIVRRKAKPQSVWLAKDG